MSERRKREIIACYDYQTAACATAYQVCEYSDGHRSVRTPDAHDPTKWRWGRAQYGVQPLPYRLPELLAAVRAGKKTMWVVPTERDADAMARQGFSATCVIGAAEKNGGEWQESWTPWVKDYHQAIVIARNDALPGKRTARAMLDAYQGQRLADRTRAALEGKVIGRVRCLVLPPIGGSERPAGPSQWFVCGGTVEGIKNAVKTAPEWRCPNALDECTSDELERFREELDAGSDVERPAKLGPAAASNASDGSQDAATPATLSHAVGVAPGVGGVADDDPRSLATLRGALVSIYSDSTMDKFRRQSIIEDFVMRWLTDRGQLFYHAEIRSHSMSLYFDAVDKVLSYVGRDYFESWLALATKINAASTPFKMLRSRVASEAMAGTKTKGVIPEKYWARRGNRMYLSCGRGRMVRCSPTGPETVDNGTDGVLFEEGRECAAWTLLAGAGIDPFETCRVFKGMSAAKQAGKVLLKLWAMSMPGHGEITKPILLLTGKGRSGKTMLARQIQKLYGLPDRAQMLSKEYKMDSFWTSADAGGMFCLDNADYFVDWLVGALCTVATGASYTKRLNYTNNELITQRARCWCAVTGVRPYFAADFTVADRLLPVEMLPRDAKDTEEGDLFADVETHRDAALTWICRVWCRALGDDAMPPLGVNARHPDWGRTAYRLARACGMEEEAVTALSDTESSKAVFSLANDVLGGLLLDAFGATGFEGSMTQLHDALKERSEEFDPEKWSKEKIGKAIKDRLSQQLEAAFGMTKKDHSGRNHYMFKPLTESLQTPSMWGVKGVHTQNAHVGECVCARVPQPPTSPTLQSSVEEGEPWDL